MTTIAPSTPLVSNTNALTADQGTAMREKRRNSVMQAFDTFKAQQKAKQESAVATVLPADDAEPTPTASKNSLAWFMAKDDPVKAAEGYIRGLEKNKSMGITYTGQSEELRHAKAMLAVVQTLAAGEVPTEQMLANLASAEAAKQKQFELGAKYQSTKVKSPKAAKAIEDAYDAAVAAWREKALAAGGTPINTPQGVQKPSTMTREEWFGKVGEFPKLADYDKGGSHYPFKDSSASKDIAAEAHADGVAKVDYGIVDGKQRYAITSVLDMRYLPNYESLSEADKARFASTLAWAQSERRNMTADFGGFEIVFAGKPSALERG